jgi:hypothetical protein
MGVSRLELVELIEGEVSKAKSRSSLRAGEIYGSA